jgi:hypothetical protein
MMQHYDSSADQIRRDRDLAWAQQQAALQEKLGAMSLADALEYLTLVFT